MYALNGITVTKETWDLDEKKHAHFSGAHTRTPKYDYNFYWVFGTFATFAIFYAWCWWNVNTFHRQQWERKGRDIIVNSNNVRIWHYHSYVKPSQIFLQQFINFRKFHASFATLEHVLNPKQLTECLDCGNIMSVPCLSLQNTTCVPSVYKLSPLRCSFVQS